MPSTGSINDTIRFADDSLEADGTGGFGRRCDSERAATGEALARRAAERARDGDREALRFLYLRYSGAVHAYVRSILGDKHAAEDVTQTVFFRLPMKLQRYRTG